MKVESYFALASPNPVGVRLVNGSEPYMKLVRAGAEDTVGLVTDTVPVVAGVSARLSCHALPVVAVKVASGIVGFA